MGNLSVLNVWRQRRTSFVHVGTIDRIEATFTYCPDYLDDPHAFQLSFSLPLREEPFSETAFRPYFEGLLPEGLPRKAKAARLGIRESDYLSMLGLSGFDCIGDVAVGPANESPNETRPKLEGIDLQDLINRLLRERPIEEISDEIRLSLAGTQDKIGLYHDDTQDLDHGWFMPVGGASSTHILKAESLNGLSCLEALCMSAAEACGIHCAPTGMPHQTDALICSKRYDRFDAGEGKVTRLHQEDFCQALGIPSSEKYLQLKPSTLSAMGTFIRDNLTQPLDALSQLMRLACFNYAIGNCDNHLKNFSLLYSENGAAITLAPTYDLVSTTFFPRFSTRMGIHLGQTADIGDVESADIVSAGQQLGIGKQTMQRIAGDLASSLLPAIEKAASDLEKHHPAAASIAWELEEEAAPRIDVLARC